MYIAIFYVACNKNMNILDNLLKLGISIVTILLHLSCNNQKIWSKRFLDFSERGVSVIQEKSVYSDITMNNLTFLLRLHKYYATSSSVHLVKMKVFI